MSVTEQRTNVVNEGMRLAVFETGNPEGEPIVLVHGWPDTHELWSHIVPLLAEKFRVISYDSRGAGASTVPQERAAYRLSSLASDFYAVIDAVSPDRPVHVLAHDWGAVEVWEAAGEPRAVLATGGRRREGGRRDAARAAAAPLRPSPIEMQWSHELLEKQAELFSHEESTNAEVHRKALNELCQALMNTNEFLYLE